MRKISVVTLLVSFVSLLLVTGCNSGNPSQSLEKKERVYNEPKAPMDEENPVVTIVMENNDEIVVELFPNIAPNTVANFLSLAEKGFYDGLIFHRVISDFMIQGGDPEGSGLGGPGYTIDGEFRSNGFDNDVKHERGIISMARKADVNSAGSQFFIMVEDATHLDGEYAAFGQVLEGMATVDSIAYTKTGPADLPIEEQRIQTINVDTKGKTYPDPIIKEVK